jgi:hypothetical protein
MTYLADLNPAFGARGEKRWAVIAREPRALIRQYASRQAAKRAAARMDVGANARSDGAQAALAELARAVASLSGVIEAGRLDDAAYVLEVLFADAVADLRMALRARPALIGETRG